MNVTMFDRAPLEKVRRLADGRIAAVAKFARSGVYTYSGTEVGRPDLATVTVYRPADEVFDQAAMASFAHKAITVGHPSDAVTADNWKQHSAGWTEGKVARDGEFVEIPLMLADASAVRAFDSGVNQLSAGYSCDLIWGDGVAPDGQRFNATQRRVRGNHIALVAAGRAGAECRLGDSTNMNDDAQVQAIVARDHAAHVATFGFLGDAAPAFDAERSAFLARANANSQSAKAIRDSAKARRNDAPPAHTPAATMSGTRSAPADTAAIRDAIRANRNRG